MKIRNLLKGSASHMINAIVAGVMIAVLLLVVVPMGVSAAQTTPGLQAVDPGSAQSTVSGNVQLQPQSTASGNVSEPTGITNPLQANSISDLVQTAAEVFTYIVILIAVIALIWTGLQYILAKGAPEKIKELKNQLLWIVIGIAIVIGARIIIRVVINTLESSGVVNQNIINNANNALK